MRINCGHFDRDEFILVFFILCARNQMIITMHTDIQPITMNTRTNKMVQNKLCNQYKGNSTEINTSPSKAVLHCDNCGLNNA